MSELSPIDAAYNNEIVLLDGLLEFHPDLFAQLSEPDRELLERYYLVGRPVPQDVFEYRRSVVQADPGLARQAQLVLRGLLDTIGIAEV